MPKPTKKSENTEAKQLPQAVVASNLTRVSKRKGVVAAVEKSSAAKAEAGKAKQARETSTPFEKPQRSNKAKIVHDKFTMPKSDHERIATLKRKCADSGIAVKKSELLSAGLLILASASDEQLAAAVKAVGNIKKERTTKA